MVSQSHGIAVEFQKLRMATGLSQAYGNSVNRTPSVLK